MKQTLHKVTIDPNDRIFGRKSFESLCRIMGWFPTNHTEKIKEIRIIVEVLE